MRESTVIISRCKAVAAHGRRCMQTPYMTSPFCWHHTARADREELRHESLRGDDHSKELAERIVGADLTAEQVQQIEQVLARP
ncbi:MAG: hypothetical protein O3B97_00385 [Actinomycetota bacterium]|nr:hypothetical protein [Thermoleophilia bacterium]MDA3005099.1 hypothetical protein [Actinomycetota bacterium]